LLAGALGCASPHAQANPSAVELEPAAANGGGATAPRELPPYVLQLGDVAEIKFFYNPELNERVTIRPDGRIALQLVGEVPAAGSTPAELAELLRERYSHFVPNAEVSVLVREFAGQRVYVGGEVQTPGVIPMSGRVTVLQAIFQAGGFKKTGKVSSVVLLRTQGEKGPLAVVLNLEEDLESLANRNDVFLRPYDVVFVPKTTIAKVNQFVEEYIRNMLPVDFAAAFYWTVP
jgi:protein involved in polysaccharide export with SLBB domain